MCSFLTVSDCYIVYSLLLFINSKAFYFSCLCFQFFPSPPIRVIFSLFLSIAMSFFKLLNSLSLFSFFNVLLVLMPTQSNTQKLSSQSVAHSLLGSFCLSQSFVIFILFFFRHPSCIRLPMTLEIKSCRMLKDQKEEMLSSSCTLCL